MGKRCVVDSCARSVLGSGPCLMTARSQYREEKKMGVNLARKEANGDPIGLDLHFTSRYLKGVSDLTSRWSRTLSNVRRRRRKKKEWCATHTNNMVITWNKSDAIILPLYPGACIYI